MNKDAYYFPHFSNARHDRKLRRIQKELGIEGYGIYFMLLEVLREMTHFSYPMEDIDLLADEFGTSEQKVRTVIANYELFEIDEQEQFFSPKLLTYLQPYFDRREKARLAANKRWHNEIEDKSGSNAQAMPEHSASNASKVKKSKVNESKKWSSESASLPSSLTTKKDCDTWKHHISKQGVDELPPGFSEVWEAYPKKTDKKGAVKKYLDTRKVVSYEKLLFAVKNYAAEVRDREKQYIKHAKTFFGPDEPWRDYLENDLTDRENHVTMVKTIDMEVE